MAHISIQSIKLIDEQIIILFENTWFQEDIIALRQALFDQIPNHYIKEIIDGADREAIRFLWFKSAFILNFDYYSQSCWISAQDDISTSNISPLFNLLTQNEPYHVR